MICISLEVSKISNIKSLMVLSKELSLEIKQRVYAIFWMIPVKFSMSANLQNKLEKSLMVLLHKI